MGVGEKAEQIKRRSGRRGGTGEEGRKKRREQVERTRGTEKKSREGEERSISHLVLHVVCEDLLRHVVGSGGGVVEEVGGAHHRGHEGRVLGTIM